MSLIRNLLAAFCRPKFNPGQQFSTRQEWFNFLARRISEETRMPISEVTENTPAPPQIAEDIAHFACRQYRIEEGTPLWRVLDDIADLHPTA